MGNIIKEDCGEIKTLAWRGFICNKIRSNNTLDEHGKEVSFP
jgi:hypothetical protein